MDALDLDITRVRALHAIACGVTRLTWLAAAERFELAMRRHALALKYNFNPAQPRVPKGEDGAGEWSGDGSSSGRIRLAGDIPTGDSPEIPSERPSTSAERTVAKKDVARAMAEYGLAFAGFAKLSAWFQTYRAEIESYNDPPRSLEQLQERVSTPEPGYDKHHIVERNQEGHFTYETINSPENLVLIPRLKHQEINSWYQTENPTYGGMSPREYLNGRSWAVQRAVGLDALRRVGVLKP